MFRVDTYWISVGLVGDYAVNPCFFFTRLTDLVDRIIRMERLGTAHMSSQSISNKIRLNIKFIFIFHLESPEIRIRRMQISELREN